MLKKLLNLNDAHTITRNEQKAMTGGFLNAGFML